MLSLGKTKTLSFERQPARRVDGQAISEITITMTHEIAARERSPHRPVEEGEYFTLDYDGRATAYMSASLGRRLDGGRTLSSYFGGLIVPTIDEIWHNSSPRNPATNIRRGSLGRDEFAFFFLLFVVSFPQVSQSHGASLR